MKYKKIMVCVDGGHSADLAIKEAIQLSKQLNAHLFVIYIVNEPEDEYADAYADFESRWAVYEFEGKEYLKRISDQLKKEKIIFDTKLVMLKLSINHLAQKIVAIANECHADLLIIPSQDYGVCFRFLGRIGEKVLEITTMPVIIIHDKDIEE